MEPEYWVKRWDKGEIGFHEGRPNRLLVTHFERLGLKQGDRVFLPLCGKTVDIAWLLDQGIEVVGIELSEMAVKELFLALKSSPVVEQVGSLARYSAPRIVIYVGDFFHLTPGELGTVSATYDRAALVALPDAMRNAYAAHLTEVTERARQLLITFQYDQALQPGPPFSISSEEVQRHYDRAYEIAPCESADVPGGLKGICPATENAWLLTAR